jgi:hypothetical protein
MAFKYEDGKVVQVSMPQVTGQDAKKMLHAKIPTDLVKRVKSRNFTTISE